MPKRSTLRLTTRSVTSLPATGRDTVYWDRDLTGFGVSGVSNPEYLK